MWSGPLWMHLDKADTLLSRAGSLSVGNWLPDSRWRQNNYIILSHYDSTNSAHLVYAVQDECFWCHKQSLDKLSISINYTRQNILKILPIYYNVQLYIAMTQMWPPLKWGAEWKILKQPYKQYQEDTEFLFLCRCTRGNQ